MRFLLLLCSLLFFLCGRAQDYIPYQQCFHRMDEDVVRHNLPLALTRLDSIERQYDFIYARHCIKALQLCAAQDDGVRAARWLARAFRQGVPLWVLRRNIWTSNALNYVSAAPVVAAYDSLRGRYHAGINAAVARHIDRLLQRDQRRTAKVNSAHTLFGRAWHGLRWLHQNRRQFHEIKRIAAVYGFPGERLIGLSPWYEDAAHFKDPYVFDGRSFCDERAYVMLVHYYSYRHGDMESLLEQGLRTGNVYGWQYGTLHDYLLRYSRRGVPYYVWLPLKDIKDSASIDRRRIAVGLNTLQQQQFNARLTKNGAGNDHVIMLE